MHIYCMWCIHNNRRRGKQVEATHHGRCVSMNNRPSEGQQEPGMKASLIDTFHKHNMFIQKVYMEGVGLGRLTIGRIFLKLAPLVWHVPQVSLGFGLQFHPCNV